MAKKVSKIPSDYTKKKPVTNSRKVDKPPFEKKERKPFQSDKPRFDESKPTKKYDRSAGSSTSAGFKHKWEGEQSSFEKKERNAYGSKSSQSKSGYKSDKAPYEKRTRTSFDAKPAHGKGNFKSDRFANDKRDCKSYDSKSEQSGGNFRTDDGPYEKQQRGSTFMNERSSYNDYRAANKSDKRAPAVHPKRNEKAGSFEDKPKRTYTKGNDTRVAKSDDKKFNDSDHSFYKSTIKKPRIPKNIEEDKKEEEMPLNKFIAHCGICSRRDAVELIKKGKVKVNGVVELTPGLKIKDNDIVLYEEKRVVAQRKLVYYLLNKPKDYITTTDDPEGRKTVMDLFKGIEDSRIFPVGRLDRNTTGLLLFTNDGELAQRLSHPKHNTKKIYQVGLDKPLTMQDFDAIANGLTLEDGVATVDEIAFTNPKDKTEIGIQIHIGRNRIVRRIFEHLNYQVKTLDRVVYAGLTKKNLPRGKWRALDEKEIVYLKHFK
jgi:23S rRNA pseudouridine2605 synthase